MIAIFNLRRERAYRALAAEDVTAEQGAKLADGLESCGTYLDRWVLLLKSIPSMSASDATKWLHANGYPSPTSRKRKETIECDMAKVYSIGGRRG